MATKVKDYTIKINFDLSGAEQGLGKFKNAFGKAEADFKKAFSDMGAGATKTFDTIGKAAQKSAKQQSEAARSAAKVSKEAMDAVIRANQEVAEKAKLVGEARAKEQAKDGIFQLGATKRRLLAEAELEKAKYSQIDAMRTADLQKFEGNAAKQAAIAAKYAKQQAAAQGTAGKKESQAGSVTSSFFVKNARLAEDVSTIMGTAISGAFSKGATEGLAQIAPGLGAMFGPVGAAVGSALSLGLKIFEQAFPETAKAFDAIFTSAKGRAAELATQITNITNQISAVAVAQTSIKVAIDTGDTSNFQQAITNINAVLEKLPPTAAATKADIEAMLAVQGGPTEAAFVKIDGILTSINEKAKEQQLAKTIEAGANAADVFGARMGTLLQAEADGADKTAEIQATIASQSEQMIRGKEAEAIAAGKSFDLQLAQAEVAETMGVTLTEISDHHDNMNTLAAIYTAGLSTAADTTYDIDKAQALVNLGIGKAIDGYDAVSLKQGEIEAANRNIVSTLNEQDAVVKDMFGTEVASAQTAQEKADTEAKALRAKIASMKAVQQSLYAQILSLNAFINGQIDSLQLEKDLAKQAKITADIKAAAAKGETYGGATEAAGGFDKGSAAKRIADLGAQAASLGKAITTMEADATSLEKTGKRRGVAEKAGAKAVEDRTKIEQDHNDKLKQEIDQGKALLDKRHDAELQSYKDYLGEVDQLRKIADERAKAEEELIKVSREAALASQTGARESGAKVKAAAEQTAKLFSDELKATSAAVLEAVKGVGERAKALQGSEDDLKKALETQKAALETVTNAQGRAQGSKNFADTQLDLAKKQIESFEKLKEAAARLLKEARELPSKTKAEKQTQNDAFALAAGQQQAVAVRQGSLPNLKLLEEKAKVAASALDDAAKKTRAGAEAVAKLETQLKFAKFGKETVPTVQAAGNLEAQLTQANFLIGKFTQLKDEEESIIDTSKSFDELTTRMDALNEKRAIFMKSLADSPVLFDSLDDLTKGLIQGTTDYNNELSKLPEALAQVGASTTDIASYTESAFASANEAASVIAKEILPGIDKLGIATAEAAEALTTRKAELEIVAQIEAVNEREVKRWAETNRLIEAGNTALDKRKEKIQGMVNTMQEVSGILDSSIGFLETAASGASGGEKVTAGADLTQKIGTAFLEHGLKSGNTGLAAAGAAIIGASLAVKAVTKIIQLIKGQALTDIQRAEIQAAKEQAITAAFDARLKIAQTLTELGNTSLDQAIEQYEYELKMFDLMLAESEQANELNRLSDEQLANMAAALEIQLAHNKQVQAEREAEGKRGKDARDNTERIKKDAIDLQSELATVNKILEHRTNILKTQSQIVEEQVGLERLRISLGADEADQLEKILMLRERALRHGLSEAGVAAKTRLAIQKAMAKNDTEGVSAILAGLTDDQLAAVLPLIQAWQEAAGAVDTYNAALEGGDKRIELLDQQLRAHTITQEERDAGVLAVLNDQLAVTQAKLALDKDNIDLQIKEQKILGDIYDLEHKSNSEVDEKNKKLVKMVQTYQKLLRAMRDAPGGSTGAAAQSALATNRADIAIYLADDLHWDEDKIAAFIATLPKYESGGPTGKGGAIWSDPNEFVMNAPAVKAVGQPFLEALNKRGVGGDNASRFLNNFTKQREVAIYNYTTNVDMKVVQHQNFAAMTPMVARDTLGAGVLGVVQRGIDSGKLNPSRG